MTIPLREIYGRQIKVSKPGHFKDNYLRTQDINMAIDECQKDIINETQEIISKKFLERYIFPVIDKWLGTP